MLVVSGLILGASIRRSTKSTLSSPKLPHNMTGVLSISRLDYGFPRLGELRIVTKLEGYHK